ncbi:hypothetical protein PLICRDRAFT_43320 [Plicaturopsis crispa FD-325 SS-3]|nr:hypothetical protein PLICRDRAFT_43320 [Plicaturopsis crispa FD-325 SS-3]
MPMYGEPVQRQDSPESVGSVKMPDKTSDSDEELSPEDFAAKHEERMGLYKPMEEEVLACESPLLYPPPKTPEEEQALHRRIMVSLRQRVAELEENELFEQTLLRGSRAALEQQPTSNDIDTIMRSMLGPSPGDPNHLRQAPTDGPWNRGPNQHNTTYSTDDGGDRSESTAGRRVVKGKGKGRRA